VGIDNLLPEREIAYRDHAEFSSGIQLSKQPCHTFVALDGLRGVAALAVVVSHEGPWIDGAEHMKHGFLAVDFFFALSGFVLAHAYSARLARDMRASGFMHLRILRLLPLYFVGWILGSGILIFTRLQSGGSVGVLATTVLLQLFFLPVLFGSPTSSAFPSNPPGWSLFFELFANLAYAIAARYLTPIVLFGICLVSAVILAIFVKLQGPILGWSIGTLLGGLPRVLYQFFAGVLVFKLHRTGIVPKIRMPIAVIAAVLIALFVFDFPNADLKYYMIASVVCMPGILAIAAQSIPEEKTARICAWLGRISYGVYVLHEPMFGAAVIFMTAFFGLSPTAGLGWPSFLAMLAVVITAAHVMTTCFDEPLRQRYSIMQKRKKSCNPA
jgi:peptidoglycan/LPS O-acetylase OafA/YrhL